ncbi:hypothetical protein B0H14DRAFT_3467212 [Mycena olivaceomarginata]|nr:hypothetical protein B0H14DRAFT_3467212 [Mycena olivaceomarginata]
MANQQLLDHVNRVQATNILLSYASSLQHNVSHNLHFFQQSWFPSEHLRFTHGLRLALDLVDPKRKDPALTGITWPAKAFKNKKAPEDWTVDEGKQFSCPLSPDSIVLASDEETTEPTPLPAAKSKGKGKTGAKKTNKRSLSPSAEQGTTKKPRKPDSKVIVTNEVVSEDETTKLTAEQNGFICADGRASLHFVPARRFFVHYSRSRSPCERCNNSHTTSACEFTFSDEVLNDLAPERALWFDMSSSGWLRAAEDLEVANENYALAQRARDSAEKEMRYKALVLLHRIVCARAEMEHNAFVARFAGDTTEERIVRMEYYLRLAMVQGITAQSRLHRRWEWNLFHPNLLLAPIPDFIDAYDFYDAYDQEQANNPEFNKLGYFLVPKPGEKGEAVWIEIQPSDLATIPLRDVFERENITLPQAYKDLDFIDYPSPRPEDFDFGFISDLRSFFTRSTVEPPLSDSLIPLEKSETPAPIGEDFLDLEAVESSGSGSGSEESDVDMPEVQPQGNVDSSSDSSSEESESGEDAGADEALDYGSEAESDEA